MPGPGAKGKTARVRSGNVKAYRSVARKKTRLTKAEARLAARRAAFDSHGANPAANPSNSSGKGHDMHRPGAL